MAELTEKQSIRRKNILFSWVGAAFFIGIVLAINFIVSFISLRLDVSAGKAYSVSKGTKQILKNLDDTLLIKVMYSPQLPPQFRLNQQYLKDLLTEYRRASHGKITLEFIDPGSSPKLKQEAMESGVMPVQLDVREKDRREVKECFMGVALFYGDKKESIPFVQDTQGLEYELTQRIKKLVNPGEVRIGFITNGYSLTLSSEPLQNLFAPIAQQYAIDKIDLNQTIPASLKSLWLIGPSKELTKAEVDKIKSWVDQGGTLGLLLDTRQVQIDRFQSSTLKTGLEDLLKSWGIDFREGFVYDPRADRIQLRSTQGLFQMVNVIDYPFFPMVSDLNRENPATKNISGVSLPFVSPLILDKPLADLKYTPLAKSSEYSWLDPAPFNVNPMQRKEKPQTVPSGPFNLGLLVEGKFNSALPDSKPGRVIIVGSSKFIRSDFPPKESNYLLFMNLLDWSAQDEVLLSIRSKGVSFRALRDMSDTARFISKLVLILGLPIFTLILGVFIWRRQKVRRSLLPLQYLES